MYMHLTNYAINKSSENYIKNRDASKDDVGHKRSMESVFDHIDRLGGDLPSSDTIWQ